MERKGKYDNIVLLSIQVPREVSTASFNGPARPLFAWPAFPASLALSLYLIFSLFTSNTASLSHPVSLSHLASLSHPASLSQPASHPHPASLSHPAFLGEPASLSHSVSLSRLAFCPTKPSYAGLALFVFTLLSSYFYQSSLGIAPKRNCTHFLKIGFVVAGGGFLFLLYPPRE